MVSLKRLILDNYYRFDIASELGLFNHVTDKKYLMKKYHYLLDGELDFDNLVTFNQKLQWLKLYDRKPKYSNMVDKYEAKSIVGELIGEQYIIPTLGIWNSFDEINFDNLPEKFVLKCTHDSGGNIIVNNKNALDKDYARKLINKCLRRNYFYTTREWPYKDVKPRVLAEKLMIDDKTKDLRDYKFFCFDGKVKFFKIDVNRYIEHRANYYDCKGNLLPFGEKICPPDFEAEIDMPQNLELMISLAEKMAEDIPFIRIDFYEVNGMVYFGEFTFYPASGFGRFVPDEWDKKIGDMLIL